MENKLEVFDQLAAIFKEHGYSLYLVGGTVRDYLFSIPLTDMDAVTDATPSEMKEFIDGDFTFAKYGSVRLKMNNVKFDITTMRKENDYEDARHPKEVVFVKDLKEDVRRRDFTINALYLDDKHQVIDLIQGLEDIKKRQLRMIGDADKRIKEDPLRITRAFRFAIDHDLAIDDELKQAIINNIELLNKLNPEKLKQDICKMKCRDNNKIYDFLKVFNATHLLDVIE